MLSALILCLIFLSESEVTTVNRCLDAAKACNIDETCQKLRTEYVSACIQPSARSGPCNRPKCNKALRKFFDRVPPDYTHELLFCPCTDTACAERRRQTIVPSCSYEDKDKPNCLAQLRICKADYVCRYKLEMLSNMPPAAKNIFTLNFLSWHHSTHWTDNLQKWWLLLKDHKSVVSCFGSADANHVHITLMLNLFQSIPYAVLLDTG